MKRQLADLTDGLAQEDPNAEQEPFRAELYSVERLEQFAAQLATQQNVYAGPRRGRLLLPRLEENGRKLIASYRALAEAIRNERSITPAAEWLVDNFHIVEEQLREIRQDLPRGYYYELPKLEGGELSGYPRIYAIALTLIAHTDSRLEADTLRRFIRAYQREKPLTIGELWAVAISLRLGLVENLRRLATRTVSAREEREEADKLADQLLELAAKQPDKLVALLSDKLGKKGRPDRAFVVQLAQRLRDQDPVVMLAYEWLEKQLNTYGTSTEQLVQREHQRQAAAQVTVGNIITSMRLLSTLDWRDFVESVSLIDPLLTEGDPVRAYAGMDFATRDRYRHVIERISKRSGAAELKVAQTAIDLAQKSQQQQPQDEARAHVGYYLIDDGVRQLEASFDYRPLFSQRVRRFLTKSPTTTYLGTLIFLSVFILSALLLYSYRHGASTGWLIFIGLLALIPASDLALAVLNFDFTHLFAPRLLPKMDLSAGVVEDARTMVVIPTIFSDEEAVRELLGRLEVHFLANNDAQIFFALLGDFSESETEERPEDAAIIEAALRGVEELNERHSKPDEQPRFYLFHRRRQWNTSERKWIGWERKRGKLHEFNRLLRGAARETSFTINTAEAKFLSSIRYVITLDSDTQLPRGSALKLIGTIIHPLNKAQLDPTLRRVTRGYGILQPRVSVTLESSARSPFARIFSGHTGIDPYTTAVSDVYQDLFEEGSYTGKGLYDVDAFEAALDERIPENSLLSHDLFESLYARAALVTDIELLDDYPAQYDVYAKRQHRWTRGDWQIARWLLPNVPDARGRAVRNHLPLIARWKIFDNLRRSLVAPAIVLWLIAAWTFLPGSPAFHMFCALLVLAFPVYAHVTTSLLIHPRGIPWTSHFWNVWGDVRTNTAQVGLTLIFLAHQATLMSDAICRTIYRKLISRKKLLEWVTAAQAERGSARSASAFVRLMWPALALSLVALVLVLYARPSAVFYAAPIILGWLSSPFVAFFVSRRTSTDRTSFTTGADVREARYLARLTWSYFETFVGDQDNWLPPDNFQEDPKPVIAHRTSPTNIGLLLLSTVAARDFGYLGLLESVERLEKTFATLAKLPRFNGHFLNWYDTEKVEPLLPQYISTVDSGNLAGHFITFKQACVEAPDQLLFDVRTLDGLRDTIALLLQELPRLGAIKQRTQVLPVKELRAELEKCAQLVLADLPQNLSEWNKLWRSLLERLEVIDDIVEALSIEHGGGNFTDLRNWIGAFKRQALVGQRDLETLTPWVLAQSSSELSASVFSEDVSRWRELTTSFDKVPTLAEIPERCGAALESLASTVLGSHDEDGASTGPSLFVKALSQGAQNAHQLLSRFAALARQSDRYVEEMDFKFLFDMERKVLSIGYNVTERRRDNSYYDLLASEARLASFVAIAKGDVMQEHWFYLGRQLTSVDGGRALISWTGTMFEYLMPALVMRNYSNTLLDQTYQAIVNRQIEYGAERGVPWGISESAYNARDILLNYQYGPFGVPGLGLKRGLSEDLVISPYSTLLASMIAPRAAMDNVRRLMSEGALGRYGFYEAIDYTPERLPQDQKRALIHNFMTHHQGMSLVSLANVLFEDIFQKRFHAEPLVQATELLLQERIPLSPAVAHPRAEEVLSGRMVRTLTAPVIRLYDTPDLPTPRTQLLSNGTYSVMVTTSGAGYSNCGPLAVTRWREDVTRDHWGNFCYLRDVRSSAVWSTGFQPIGRMPQKYEVSFSEHKVRISRRDAGIITHTEIIVSPEDNAEVRRITLTNQSARAREIEVTSYSEIVLAPPAADAAHPAFSNLFIETEFIAAENALLARRRQRSQTDKPVWGVHVVVTDGEAIGNVQYETDRSRFLGRGHTVAEPVAVMEDRPLSNTVGAVLDPVFSLRRRIRLQPNETAHVTFTTALANTREEALMLADKYHDVSTFEREEKLSWTQTRVEMRHLNIDPEEMHLFQRLAGRVLYLDPSLRPRSHVLELNSQTQSSLWRHGISGDLPIILVRIGESGDLNMVRQILRSHEYLRLKGLTIDLVILNDQPVAYLEILQDELQNLIRASGSQALVDKSGGVFLRRSDALSEADRILLHTVARVVIVTDRGTLEEQLTRRPFEEDAPPPLEPRWPSRTYPEPIVELPELKFFNGLGGFDQGGREYVTVLGEGQWTPAPWLNVIANGQDFGFQVDESGSGYTWSVNSRENRLTAWSNDAVSDPPSEAIYLRDEDTGTVWTPTPLPIRERDPYVIRHGQGYTVFEHTSHGITQELLQFVPLDASVKISLLRLRNRTERRRKISVTAYHELVLGFDRARSAPFVITELDTKTGALFARNPYNNEFASRLAFVATSGRERTVTGDRTEFIGRNGTHTMPAALRRSHLSDRVGAGFDPCAAIQTSIELAPGEAKEVIILLGETENAEQARTLINSYLRVGQVNQAFEQVVRHWDDLLNRVEVRTPDGAMDMILNRWLLYQTLVCRIWSRSAFYQSGGAYGFRDQLQDVMALIYTRPDITRAQILRAAAHQYKEGDVQHWWHPPTGRGVRTRFSDDLLWLPFVTNFYLQVTNDRAILDEQISFLESPLLKEGEDETYLQPEISRESASLFEHCIRALDRSLAVGEHGLPLMGSGDWNDGMNRVGREGKGESVWVGWFLYKTLREFAPFCDERGEMARAARYREHMDKLKIALEEHAWDGDWYRRAYFDDGTPLGSAINEECRIDSIVQSWGVISGAADPQRAVRAMASVEEYLIRRGDGLVILFSPPFDHSPLDPGYIKGYVPGVRENGGQYTHAAIWTLIAYAELKDGDRAGELFALLNPINHASTRAGLHKYKVEPYVAAGDVYAVWPHTGRGGWTWYTGSAGWMYRAGLESILGFQIEADRLLINPCIPRVWRGYEINYRHGSTLYQIRIENPHNVSHGIVSLELDGVAQRTAEVVLQNDERQHNIRIVLGDAPHLPSHTEPQLLAQLVEAKQEQL